MHKAVLLNEAVDALNVVKGENYIDATYGFGGHSNEIVKRGGNVLALEADPEIFAKAKNLPANLQIVNGNFKDIKKIALENNFNNIKGILFDLGLNSFQLDNLKGFSFENLESELDMRLNPGSQSVTAAMLLNALPEVELFNLFNVVLDYPESKSIAKNVVEERRIKSFKTVSDFRQILKFKPTKPFMALRIAVNSEYQNLKEALLDAFELLDKDGKLVCITFHSGEDKIVKNFFKEVGGQNNFIAPTEKEIDSNKRSRSAKLRILTKK